MKLSYTWLKDYLPIDLPPNELSILLTDIGLEVEAVEQVQSIKGGMAGLVVGEVLTAEKHPDADKLTLTTVNIGEPEPLPIVCGAPNVAVGQKVIVATVGTTLYPISGEPFAIKKAKIRGAASMGMICAQDEIGLGSDHSGIIVLPPDTPVGTPAKKVFNLDDDYVFEIGLTPNRSDAGCHIGIAQDLYAAILVRPEYQQYAQLPINLPDVSTFAVTDQSLPIAIEVHNTDACPHYAGISIKGITVQASPDWLQRRLEAVGIRAINNIVDITNFVLYELGQPLHAFDADQISEQKVIVRNLPDKTKFTTLDGQERSLDADDLLICDGKHNPMCIAGVFGGAKSGVTAQTTRIFLESACFDPKRTRRSKERHNLRTESATRFEKGVDPNLQVYALKRAALLICELSGGTIASNITDIYPQPIALAQVRLTYRNLQRITGVNLSPAAVKHIAHALNMSVVGEDSDSLSLAIPTNKADVTRECDVIEEIIRIYGLNNIPVPQQLSTVLAHAEQPDQQAILHQVGDYLAANGYLEIMANSISNATYYDNNDLNGIRLLKSLNANYDILRQTLLFGGLEAIAHNQNYRYTDLKLFEYGKIYSHPTNNSEQANTNDTKSKAYIENNRLSIWLTGNISPENWRQKSRKADFFDLKEMVVSLLNKLGIGNIKAEYVQEHPHFAYGLQLAVGKKRVGIIGNIKKSILKQFDLKNEVWYADLDWENIVNIAAKQKTIFKPIVKYPVVRRDLALVLDKSIAFEQIPEIALKNAKNWLQSVDLFDVYEDENKLGAGKKSYAVAFRLQDDNRTLTDADIDNIMQKLIQAFELQLNANVRQ